MIRMNVTAVGLNNVLKKLGKVKGKINPEVTRIFKESAKNIEKNSKNIVRVDTGRLQKSIKSHVTNPNKNIIGIYCGTNVPYSIYVERKYPYLFPAMEMEKPNLIRKLQSIDLSN